MLNKFIGAETVAEVLFKRLLTETDKAFFRQRRAMEEKIGIQHGFLGVSLRM